MSSYKDRENIVNAINAIKVVFNLIGDIDLKQISVFEYNARMKSLIINLVDNVPEIIKIVNRLKGNKITFKLLITMLTFMHNEGFTSTKIGYLLVEMLELDDSNSEAILSIITETIWFLRISKSKLDVDKTIDLINWVANDPEYVMERYLEDPVSIIKKYMTIIK